MRSTTAASNQAGRLSFSISAQQILNLCRMSSLFATFALTCFSILSPARRSIRMRPFSLQRAPLGILQALRLDRRFVLHRIFLCVNMGIAPSRNSGFFWDEHMRNYLWEWNGNLWGYYGRGIIPVRLMILKF